MTAGTTLAWPQLLDALEEHTRRVAALLDAPDGDPVPPPPFVPAGPLPEVLAPRVRALLAETSRLERLAETRLARTRQALAYSTV